MLEIAKRKQQDGLNAEVRCFFSFSGKDGRGFNGDDGDFILAAMGFNGPLNGGLMGTIMGFSGRFSVV